ncbi:hypothetical protein DK419_00945 [Methylobacterium terrae]|uniref:Uncharacterized protein n=1 Tax=Methylobacterium terrae TaxID=2202827 RepID=A0A2U8WFR9_9HYPH|nr:hypothetical protein DK419_00945 [Methylobacterium terrae]
MSEIGPGSLDLAAAVLAHRRSAEELAVEDATSARRRNAVKTAALLVLPIFWVASQIFGTSRQISPPK